MEAGYDERFGSGAAIFAGNMMLSLALQAILSSGFDAGRLVRTAGTLLSEFRNVNESQVLDLEFEYGSPDVSDWNVMASKRATTLFRATLGIGAILAGAPEKDLKTLSDAGEHIGYAFDIQDDIIDTYASADQYGRVPGADILRGKKPLHVVLAIRRDEEFASMLRETSAGRTRLDIEQVRKAVSSSGALEEAKKISRDHADAGSRLISQTAMRDESKQFFVSFIGYVKESLEWYK
jgi:geranylgeranyl diphosphate synthase type II